MQQSSSTGFVRKQSEILNSEVPTKKVFKIRKIKLKNKGFPLIESEQDKLVR